MNMLNVILASASPRRRAFLAALGIPHHTVAADIDETPQPGESATALAARLAQSKARHIALALAPAEQPALVIGADTVVALEGELLGKPASAEAAAAMLAALRGRVHQVHSGLAVVQINGEQISERVVVNTTDVTMRDYSDEEIAAYVATGDPLDKAGGYAIQHRGFEPVARLAGCPGGVMGMPAADLLALLLAFGISSAEPIAPVCRGLTGLPCCQIDSLSGG